MVHEVHVRRADGGAERLQQELAGTRYGVGVSRTFEPAVPQNDCSQSVSP